MTSWNPPTLTWLITGAGSGFGLALTRLALAGGHTVIATSRNPSRISPELVSEVELHSGSRWLALDVNDINSAEIIHKLENEQDTHIDVLVSNAGMSLLGPAESFTEEEVRQQFETSFFGPYRLIRAVVPYMRRRRRGMIVNISSGAGIDGRESMAIYGGSKAALDGLVRVLAREIAPFNIRSLTVQLGGFDTKFANASNPPSTPFPEEYKDHAVQRTVNAVMGGNFKPDGDHKKAAKAIYDVIVGQGVGEGKETERVLPLGRDVGRMIDGVTEATKHTMETFRHVCDNVYLDNE